ncbi:hypothetical protein [Pseudoxanthomonas sp.]|uniref:hypothetical protein n=1 Tax=Pseudoxanthomonas sp. TaxID=1871049 RepID=UPI002625AB95|nr:hypothetical protein [Pseudoxanthomonas sp.]WDS35570.1 MAG: hypothetical protein O8I58_14695 [Pseudoxanthomonas sp.]
MLNFLSRATLLSWLLMAMLLSIAKPAAATTSVWFSSKHYSLTFEVGHDDRPVITGMQIIFDEMKEIPWVRSPDLKVTRFDYDAQWIEVEYVNPGDTSKPPSFHLSAKGNKGTIRFKGHSETGEFLWTI